MEAVRNHAQEHHKSGEVPLVSPQIIYIMGPEGSGKSTQANLLSGRTNLPVLSAGNIFRELQALENESELGKRARTLQEKGGYADGALFHDAMEYWLSANSYKNGVIIEGAPRTADQVEVMRELALKHIGDMPNHLVFLNMPRSMAANRIAGRKPRTDDPQLDTRLDEHYKNLAEKVRGMDAFADVGIVPTIIRSPKGEVVEDRSIREVNEEIVDKLGIDKTKIRTIHEAGLSDGDRQVVDLHMERVGHDICTLPKAQRASAIRAYIQNVDETLTATFGAGEGFESLTHMREYLELKLAETV